MPRPRALAWLAPLALIALLLGLRACVHVDPLDRLSHVPHAPKDPARTQIYTGSIDVEDGGPVQLGFQGRGSHLKVDGVEYTGRDCKFITEGTLCFPLLKRGAHAVWFAASPGARLVWNPVGRRGDPTYVLASSLSPEPPETATFDHPDVDLADGLIALAILLVVVGTLLALARRRLLAVPRSRWLAMGAIFLAACVVRWIDLGGFGQAWDEDTNWNAGRNYVSNLLSLDVSERSWTWNFEHPPVMKYLEGVGAQLSNGFGVARVMSAVWISLGCALMVPIGARLYGERAGLVAGGIAALLPPLVAHGQIVGHESPSVLWWTLAILLALSVHDELATRRQLAVRMGWVAVVIGVATASRFVNGLCGVLCVAIVLVRAPRAWRVPTLVGCAIMPVVALATVYAIWPRLWLHPVARLVESFGRLSATQVSEPFLGGVTKAPGPHYFVVYLVATLPLLVLLGVVAGIARTARTRVTRVIVAAWFVIPLGVMASPVRQGGVRYVLPCVLALAMLAGAGWDGLATRLEARVGSRAFPATCAALALYLAVVLFRAQPYYLDYFGEQVGGASTVGPRHWFETAWWGEGVDRAVGYVNEHAAPGDKVSRDCVAPSHLTWFREDLWPTVGTSAATWIVWYAPDDRTCSIPPGAVLAYEVENNGLVLAQVWKK